MDYYFDLEELKQDLLNARMFSARFERKHFERVDNLKDLCGRLPEDEECFFIETTKSFNAFTFLVYLIRHSGRIESLFIATYSINDRIINSLIRYMDKGLIGSVSIEISESIKFRMKNVTKRLDLLANENKISLVYEWTHRKVSCIETEIGYYVVEGSGNLGENAMKEQYIFSRSKELYEFRLNKTS
ncbi:MAG TPA: hypothetical protein VIK29_07660 [Paludibacter sp.]